MMSLIADQVERKEGPMDVQETISKARDAITVKRVYGEPYEHDGVTVIPAAVVVGAGGGGAGEDTQRQQVGGGSGFGLGGRPVGAFVIAEGEVSWRPAFDVTRIAQQALIAAGLVAVLYLRRRG
jgi:uncharacterized spore protein YtfJ